MQVVIKQLTTTPSQVKLTIPNTLILISGKDVSIASHQTATLRCGWNLLSDAFPANEVILSHKIAVRPDINLFAQGVVSYPRLAKQANNELLIVLRNTSSNEVRISEGSSIASIDFDFDEPLEFIVEGLTTEGVEGTVEDQGSEQSSVEGTLPELPAAPTSTEDEQGSVEGTLPELPAAPLSPTSLKVGDEVGDEVEAPPPLHVIAEERTEEFVGESEVVEEEGVRSTE